MPISPKSAMQRLEGKRIEISTLHVLPHSNRGIIADGVQNRAAQTKPDMEELELRVEQEDRRCTLALLKIEQAFLRLENGDFGYCVDCGEKIPLTLLEKDPTVTLCTNCSDKKKKKNDG